jgi:DNA-binding CsgD family transcriptional regulator
LAKKRSRKRTYKAPLTDKEKEILCLLAMSDVDIAQRLYRSYPAIKQGRGAIFKKLGVHNRTEALIKAIRQGEIDVWDVTLPTDEF